MDTPDQITEGAMARWHAKLRAASVADQYDEEYMQEQREQAKQEAFDYETRRLWIETAVAYTKNENGFGAPCHEYANKVVDEFIKRFQTDA